MEGYQYRLVKNEITGEKQSARYGISIRDAKGVVVCQVNDISSRQIEVEALLAMITILQLEPKHLIRWCQEYVDFLHQT